MQQAQQIDGLAFDAPRPANAEIAELGGLVGGVPALHDALEAIRLFVLTIALEPFGLDQAVAQWGGGLLILAGEIDGQRARPGFIQKCATGSSIPPIEDELRKWT